MRTLTGVILGLTLAWAAHHYWARTLGHILSRGD